MTYNDYGHINPDPKVTALTVQWGPKSVITFPSGGQQLSGPGFYDISGLACPVEALLSGWKYPPMAERNGRTLSCGRQPIAWRIPALASTGGGTGKKCTLLSRCTDELGQVQPTVAPSRQVLWRSAG